MGVLNTNLPCTGGFVPKGEQSTDRQMISIYIVVYKVNKYTKNSSLKPNDIPRDVS